MNKVSQVILVSTTSTIAVGLAIWFISFDPNMTIKSVIGTFFWMLVIYPFVMKSDDKQSEGGGSLKLAINGLINRIKKNNASKAITACVLLILSFSGYKYFFPPTIEECFIEKMKNMDRRLSDKVLSVCAKNTHRPWRKKIERYERYYNFDY